MSKLDNKFLENYSLDSLRDSSILNPTPGQVLVFNGVTSKWENGTLSPVGQDIADFTKEASEQTTGATFTTYATLNFSVSAGANNRYRMNVDFLWGHNAGGNDIRVRTLLDGVSILKELQIEPKDPGTDQRIQNNLLSYVNNLTPGNHTLELQYRPSNANRVSYMYSAVLEVWRTQ